MSNLPFTSGPATAGGAGGGAAASFTSAPPSTARSPRSRAVLLTLTAAAAAGLLVWAAAVPLAGIELELATGQIIGPVSILGAALVGGALGWLLLALLVRLPWGRTVWSAVAAVVLLLSLTGPLLSGAAGGVLLILELMHLAVGLVLILGLRRSTAARALAGTTVTTEES